MNCEREIEIVDALMDGRWPDGCDAALREHARTCELCGEVVTIAGAVRAKHLASMKAAAVPPSGVVWWRAQRRARQEAIETATNAITTVQATLFGIAIVVALTTLGFTHEMWKGWLARLSDYIAFGALQFTPATDVVLLVGAATAILLAPVVVWFAVRKE